MSADVAGQPASPPSAYVRAARARGAYRSLFEHCPGALMLLAAAVCSPLIQQLRPMPACLSRCLVS